MTELEMYELWCTLRLWANYNQLNQTIEKNWLSNSFNAVKYGSLCCYDKAWRFSSISETNDLFDLSS